MVGRILIAVCGLIAGAAIGYLVFTKVETLKPVTNISPVSNIFVPQKGEVIGFLPFWLIARADPDYSKYITTLSYFALTIDGDGTIKRYTNPIEGDPGWFSLKGGNADSFISSAKEKGIRLSLVMFTSDEEVIA